MAKRKWEQWNRFSVIAAAVSYAVYDHLEDIAIVNGIKRSSPIWWRDPYSQAREDPTQRNTMAKLEVDLLRLGCVDEFRRTTRMMPCLHQELLDLVRPLIQRQDTNWRKAIPVEDRLSLTIRYLAHGDSVFSLHQSYLVAEKSVLPIVRDTCRALYRVLHEQYLKTPSTEADWRSVAQGFHDKWNFPHVLGAVDGKHVRIKRPRNSGSQYYNYKSFYSIVLLAVVDSDYKFLYVDVGAEGKSSDSSLWSDCQFNCDIQDPANPLGIPPPEEFPGHQGEMNFFFIGDDAFSLAPQMMKPFPQAKLSLKQRIFNYRVCRPRRVVENTFGILCTRFRLLRREIDMEPEGARDVVMAIICLHNFLKSKVPNCYTSKPETDWEDKDYNLHRGEWRKEIALVSTDRRLTKKNHSMYVRQVRERLMYWCLTKEGECPWQYEAVLKPLFYGD